MFKNRTVHTGPNGVPTATAASRAWAARWSATDYASTEWPGRAGARDPTRKPQHATSSRAPRGQSGATGPTAARRAEEASGATGGSASTGNLEISVARDPLTSRDTAANRLVFDYFT